MARLHTCSHGCLKLCGGIAPQPQPQRGEQALGRCALCPPKSAPGLGSRTRRRRLEPQQREMSRDSGLEPAGAPHTGWAALPGVTHPRFPGPNVDWGREASFLGKMSTHICTLSLEWTRISWAWPPPRHAATPTYVACWSGGVPSPGSRPAEAVFLALSIGGSGRSMDFRQEVGAHLSFHCLFGGENTLVACDGCEAGGCGAQGHHMSLGSGGCPLERCLTASAQGYEWDGAVLINHLVALNRSKLGDLQVISCCGTTS